jgi:hypothetical protein
VDVSNIEPVDVEKVTEENPQSRFRILDVAIHKPGVCALCGSAGGDGRQFVDFGKTMDWYGVVYFCTFCVGEAAQLLGFERKSNWVTAEANLQKEISDVDDRYVDAKVKLDAAMVLLRNCTCANSDSGVPIVEIPEADVIESESNDPYESNSDESDSVEGSDGVSEPSGDDESEPTPRSRRTRKSSG